MSTSSQRLSHPHTASVRAVRGPLDLEVVLRQEELGLSLWVLREGNGAPELAPFDHATLATTLTPDGAHILELDDTTGSELGHLHAFPIGGGPGRDLTPERDTYTIRGIDCALDSRSVLITGADESGFFALLASIDDSDAGRVIFHSPHEAWSGLLSADATLASTRVSADSL